MKTLQRIIQPFADVKSKDPGPGDLIHENITRHVIDPIFSNIGYFDRQTFACHSQNFVNPIYLRIFPKQKGQFNPTVMGAIL